MKQYKWMTLFFAFAFIVQSVNAQNNYDLNAKLPLDPVVRYGTLSNGMKYYIRKHGKPEKRAEFRIALNAGSLQENEDQRGLAHFCEHMCFNGTKNFKKSALVDYLESVGTKFGAHLNAETGFEETIYKLQLPTDKEEIMNKGLLILQDWAFNVTFENEEIDKERGVVMEEWRLGQGAQERMRNKYWPVLFKDSRYENRLPIGTTEVLQHCKYETLKNFYKEWYRPELMAVIAVGDFDLDKMEASIKEKFSAVPARKDGRPAQDYEVPDNKEIRIGKATDKEANYTTLQLMYKYPVEKMTTVNDYRKSLINQLYTTMLNERYSELQQQANPPFIYAGSSYDELVRTKNVYASFVVVNEKGLERGLETIAEENERVKRFGFTSSELERAKKALIRGMEKSFNERDKIESRSYANEYVYHYLKQIPAPGLEYEYGITKQHVGGITLDEVNALSKKLITNGENCLVVINAPEKEGVIIPSDEKIKSILMDVQKKTLKPYEDKMIDKPLLAAKPAAGKIVEEKQNAELGVTELKLSNGIKVFLKPTDFKNDEILFSSYSFGGWSNTPEKDDISATAAASIVDYSGLGEFDNVSLQKLLTGKVINISPNISELTEGFYGSVSPQDAETMMQLIYLYFTQPRKDATAFASLMEQQLGSVQNRSLSPEAAYQDTIEVTMSQYHFRSRPVTTAILKEMDLDKAYNIYKDRFADAGDFTFSFVGNFKVDEFKKLIADYIGGLPTTGRKESWKDIGMRPPKGVVQKTVKRGTEPKASVNLRFTGDFKYNRTNRYDMNALVKLMSIKLREVLREEKGGTYGVQVYPVIKHYPVESYEIVVGFGCAPDRVEDLTKAALEVIAKVKQIGAEEKDLTKIKETLRREYETNLKDNRFWLNTISSSSMNGEPLPGMNEYNQYIENLKGDTFGKLATQYFNLGNYAKFVLTPEK